jgi:hypothetical protein
MCRKTGLFLFSKSCVSFLIILFSIWVIYSSNRKINLGLQVYIVYFGGNNGEKSLHEIQDTHHSYLLSVKTTEDEARDSLLYSYKHSINGFAALLTPEEASKLSGKGNYHHPKWVSSVGKSRGL